VRTEVIAMKKSVRWLPAVIAPAIVAAAVIAVPAVADAAAAPPAKSAEQVLALIAKSADAHYSGTVRQSSSLGLPQLPATGAGSGSADAAVLDLLTASHTVRVFADGPGKQRLQVLDSLAERDVVRNGAEVWGYDSKQNEATHLTLPSKSAKADLGSTTPGDLATKLVEAIDPSTRIAVDKSASVAGRPAYRLTLTPKSAGTLVADVTLSVDASTGLPLKVVVDAKGQKDPAFSVGFTSIDFSAPAARTFEFTPPKGAKVTTESIPEPSTHSSTEAMPRPTVTGTGWDSIVELPSAGSVPAPDPSQTALLDELTTAVDGGRALQTSLVSVLLSSDGRVLAGAVPVSALVTAAAQ